MSVLNDIKQLINQSRLFVDPAKQKVAGRRRKSSRDVVKIGQGGTLDPLADGVLGKGDLSVYSASVSRVFEPSHRNRERNEDAEPVLGVREGDAYDRHCNCEAKIALHFIGISDDVPPWL